MVSESRRKGSDRVPSIKKQSDVEQDMFNRKIARGARHFKSLLEFSHTKGSRGVEVSLHPKFGVT